MTPPAIRLRLIFPVYLSRSNAAPSHLKFCEGVIMRYFSKTTAAVALFALAVPAMADAQPKAAPAKPAAAVSGVNGDVRCLLTMVALGQNKERQQAAQLGVYYFAGRISARAPGLNLATLMRSEAGTLDGKALEAESR